MYDYASEKSRILDKRYTCPICDKQITAKAVKSNTARFLDSKADLRPIHSNINVTKYETVCCPNCGYAVLTKNIDNINQIQKKLIRDKIQANYKPHEEPSCDYYTTEMAISRMKMVLLCTVTKEAKSSEIGDVCLKLSWLYQDLADEIAEDDPNADSKRNSYLTEAKNAAMNAYNYLSEARMHEVSPFAGMNETTLDYLLADLAYQKGEYQTAMQFLSNVVANRNTTPRLKDKSLDLKELLSARLHGEEEA